MQQVYVKEPGIVSFFEASKPEAVAPDAVIIKVVATGICATDVHTFLGQTIHGKRYPFHIGHEISGIVESVGAEVKSVKIGDTVVVNPLVYCGICEECKSGHWNYCSNMKAIGLTGPGGFSDYISTIERNVNVYKKATAEEMTFAEPLATVLHAIDLLGDLTVQSVLIQGAGTLGMLFLKSLSYMYESTNITVSDPDTSRHALITNNGAKSITPQQLQGSWDIVIDCTGNAMAVERAVQYLNNHGILLLFGVCPHESRISLSPFKIYRKELTIKGAYALNNNLDVAVRMLDDHLIIVTDLISDVISRDALLITLQGLAERRLSGKYIVKQ